MRFRGHPWLGAISGLLLGIGVAVLLQQFAVRPIDNLSFFGLPLLGVVLGLAVAAWAPFGRGRAVPSGATASAPSSPRSEPTSPTEPVPGSEPPATSPAEPPATSPAEPPPPPPPPVQG